MSCTLSKIIVHKIKNINDNNDNDNTDADNGGKADNDNDENNDGDDKYQSAYMFTHIILVITEDEGSNIF